MAYQLLVPIASALACICLHYLLALHSSHPDFEVGWSLSSFLARVARCSQHAHSQITFPNHIPESHFWIKFPDHMPRS